MSNSALDPDSPVRPWESLPPDDAAEPLPTRTATDRRDRELELAAVEYACPEEIGDVVEMYEDFDERHVAQGLPPRGDDALREWLAALARGLHVVARHAGRTVGHATLVPREDEEDEDAGDESAGNGATADEANEAERTTGKREEGAGESGHELAIFVHQDYRGAGVGTRLLETLCSYGERVGVEDVRLLVERHNRPAIRLYDGIGFETTEAWGGTMEMRLDLPAEPGAGE
ncbi:GNAT family N-acetyltransferase [Halorarum halobium]|uniref:GNAT family N-acetyltransferase n=1 Tax=Halorarum halobium TaxID=3075121 RepID=UPI0028A7D3A9|nr:GNAT family N-acetyltransferase [Halobaculum sp. XH14]